MQINPRILYCSIVLNHFVQLTFSGSWSHPSLLPFELITTTSKTKLIHISSVKRLVEMTTVSNKTSNDCVWTMGGRVIMRNILSGQEVLGYVKGENEIKMKIKLMNTANDEIVVNRPRFIIASGEWIYPQNEEGSYLMIKYDPIRIKITKTGRMIFTMTRILLDKDGNMMKS